MNIIDLLYESAARVGEAPAFIERDRPVSYRELADDVRRYAAWLRSRGIGSGDNVLVLIPMSVDLYRTLLALFHLGATAVFVDAWAGADRIDMAASRLPIAAFIGSMKAQLLRFRSPALRTVPIKIVAGGSTWRRNQPLDTPAESNGDDTALVTFTTGSTGVPKGARRTHRFLVTQHLELVRHTRSGDRDVDMATLPIFPLSNLASGATTLLASIDPRQPDRFDGRDVIRSMRRHGVTSAVASPAFFDRLCRALIGGNEQLDSFSRAFVGGAPVYPSIAKLMRSAFPSAELIALYGATEVEPISTISIDDIIRLAPDQRGLPVGEPVESLALRVLRLDPAHRYTELSAGEAEALTCEVDEPGEICVSGEHVLSDYIDPADGATSRLMIDGRRWHRTGDAGYIGEDRRLYLLGRIKRRIRRDGAWLYPVEVESRLAGGGLVGTLVDVDGTVVAAIEGNDGAGVVEALERLEIPSDRIAMIRELPRDPRHRSKIDYESLTGLLQQLYGNIES